MRFLHTADWQWGMPAHFLRNEEARARYRAARLDAVRRIGEIAEREQCAFVLVCGDVFDANQLSRETVLRSFEALREIKVPVYLLPGNHDPYEPGSIYSSAEFERFTGDVSHVHVLSEPGIHRVSDDIEIVAAPWLSKRPTEDLVSVQLERLTPAPHGPIRILAGHGALDAMSPDADLPYLIRRDDLRSALDERRVHYAALGDRHSRDDLGLAGRAWYSGTPEVTDYDEHEPGHVLVVDLGDIGERCTVTSHRTGVWAFSVIAAQLENAADVENLNETLRAIPGKDTSAVKLALRGTLSLREHARLEALIDEYAHVFAHIRQWESHTDLAVMPDGDEVGDLKLSGYAAEAFEELQRSANPLDTDNEGAPTAQDALRLLYRLVGGTR
jgi:DNA repair exonuclease SbcCD nuclease subunit